MNGTVTYSYNATLGFQSILNSGAILTLHDIPNSLFNWSFSTLNPAECRYMDVRFTMPTTTALGTNIQGTASVNPIAGDATPNNNTDIENETVVGSWDPNDKRADHEGDRWTTGNLDIYQ